MSYTAEVIEIKRRILVWLFLLIVFTIVLCGIGFEYKNVTGLNLPIPSSEATTLTSQFFLKASSDLLPTGVEIISTSPITVFIVQIRIALLGSFAVLLPYLLFSFINYLSPALFPNEKRKLAVLVVSSMLLFILGMLFAYNYLIDSMFKVLLSFNMDFNVIPYLEVNEFVGWTLAALFMTGILFLLPIFMYSLTLAKITSSLFWRSKWREAFIIFLVVSSIITPDVSGVSVILLTIPMSLLYGVGIMLSLLYERRQKRK